MKADFMVASLPAYKFLLSEVLCNCLTLLSQVKVHKYLKKCDRVCSCLQLQSGAFIQTNVMQKKFNYLFHTQILSLSQRLLVCEKLPSQTSPEKREGVVALIVEEERRGVLASPLRRQAGQCHAVPREGCHHHGSGSCGWRSPQ